MSPILVRPVREQLEHDRIIRLLQVRLKRRGDVVANLGPAQTTPVKIGQVQVFPDLVVFSADKNRKLLGTVEVETAESVNHLEAMAEWVHYGRAKVPFHLYIPSGSVDAARRLIAENAVGIAEIWTYHTIGDQTRFTMVHRAPNAEVPKVAPEPRQPAAPAPAAPAAKTASTAVRRAAAVKRAPVAKAPAARKARPARKAAPAPRKAAARPAARKAAARKAAPKRAQKRK